MLKSLIKVFIGLLIIVVGLSFDTASPISWCMACLGGGVLILDGVWGFGT